MKILLIVSSYAPNAGGLQIVTRQLAGELRARGHSVAVVTNRYPRTLAANEILDGVQVIRWHFLTPRWSQLLSLRFGLFVAGFLYLPLTLTRLIFLLRRERPDVVNLHFVGAPALFVFLARWFVTFRLVVSLHGDDVEGLSERGRFDRWVFRSLLRRAEGVTACSQYLLEQALRIEPSAKQKGLVIHNGMEPSNAGVVRNTGEIFAAGRMVPKKGFDVLLRAHADGQNRSRLTLMGDGPERERLEQLARILELNGEVSFRGNQDHDRVLEEMAAADVVAIPSLQEPFGLIALEAMSLGKPIVASRVGGLPEVLEGADALLVKPGDASELAAALETTRGRLRDDPGFGARNRELAARFSTDRMTRGYLQAYGHNDRESFGHLRNSMASLPENSDDVTPLQIQALILLMLLLQYNNLFRVAFVRLGIWQSMPLTLIFLSTLGGLLFLPESRLPKRLKTITSLSLVPVALLWIGLSGWAYFRGSTIRFPTILDGLIVGMISGSTLIVGLATKRLWIACVGLGIFLSSITYFQVTGKRFDSTFTPGRPIWVVQNAITNIGKGVWPYRYHDPGTLSYPPFLVLPYLPFGWAKIDLRWANLAGAVILLASLWWTGKERWLARRNLALVVVFLSPAFVFNLVTSQLAFYWICLLWLILATRSVSASSQRLPLLVACLTRQLAWPLVLPWTLYQGIVRKPQHKNSLDRSGPRSLRIDWSFARLNWIEFVLLLIVAVSVLISPSAFYWSTFVWAMADGWRAVAAGTIQPVGNIAITPLLPYASHPSLVLLSAGSLVVLLTVCLWRTKILLNFFPQSMIATYAAFLCLGFMVHNYYWIDVIVMTLGYLWCIGRTPEKRATLYDLEARGS